MAIILRGKLKGQKVTPAQWCNNWISIKESPKIFLITALHFSHNEILAILASKDLGYMLKAFKLQGHRFKRRKKLSNGRGA